MGKSTHHFTPETSTTSRAPTSFHGDLDFLPAQVPDGQDAPEDAKEGHARDPDIHKAGRKVVAERAQRAPSLWIRAKRLARGVAVAAMLGRRDQIAMTKGPQAMLSRQRAGGPVGRKRRGGAGRRL